MDVAMPEESRGSREKPSGFERKRHGSGKKPRGTAKDRALLLLSVRWRSRQELRRRLLTAGFEKEEIETALVDLEQVGLVEDQRFAREVVRDQSVRRLAGNRAIRGSLLQKGVAREIVDAAIEEAGDEEERARLLAVRKAERMRALPPEAAFRRLYGVLLRRGFGPQTAREACRAALQEVLGDALTDES